MHAKIKKELKEKTETEIVKQEILRDFYLHRAESQSEEDAAQTKLKASNLEDTISFNKEFLAFIK